MHSHLSPSHRLKKLQVLQNRGKEGIKARMGPIIRSKAIVLLAMQITLVTFSPAPVLADDLQPDISKRDMCKMWCSLKCYPETSPLQPCILACMTDCMGKPSAISGCNLGCVMASCLSNADPAG